MILIIWPVGWPSCSWSRPSRQPCRKLSLAQYILSTCGNSLDLFEFSRCFRIFSSSEFSWSTEPWTVRTYSLAIFMVNLISLLGLIQRLICENESLWISWSCEKMIKWINLLFIPIIIIDKNLRNDDVNKLTFHTFWWRHDKFVISNESLF